MSGLMDEYTHWANGWGCGFQILDARGNELDSCYGFLDQDDCLEQAKNSAERYATEEAA